MADVHNTMSRLDELPPDQRAALSLLLRQHKSYAEVATLLGIAEIAVHDRAHGALAVLAPRRARELTPERRLEIGDYLLGQQPGVAERLRTRTYLSSSEPARAWAGEIAAQLAPLAGAGLPEIPAAANAAADVGASGPQRVGDLSSTSPAPTTADTGAAPAAASRSPASSRVGGAVLLVVILAAVVVAVVLLTGGGSGNKTASIASKTAGTTSSATKTGPAIDDQIKLKPTSAKSRIEGIAYVLAEGATRAFFIEAENLPQAKGFYYAIWLYNSRTSFMGLSKSSDVGSNHRLEGGSRLPSNAGEFHEVILTKETKAKPRHPGSVLLRGPFSLH
jgi:Sigma-70, region 4